MWEIVCPIDQTLIAKVKGKKGSIPEIKDYDFYNATIRDIKGRKIIQCPSTEHGDRKVKPIWHKID